jgi:hypothetical protein
MHKYTTQLLAAANTPCIVTPTTPISPPPTISPDAVALVSGGVRSGGNGAGAADEDVIRNNGPRKERNILINRQIPQMSIINASQCGNDRPRFGLPTVTVFSCGGSKIPRFNLAPSLNRRTIESIIAFEILIPFILVTRNVGCSSRFKATFSLSSAIQCRCSASEVLSTFFIFVQ